MSDKKRKSSSKDSERPSKKQQIISSVQVSHLNGPDVAKPVIATSPGVDFPRVAFDSFVQSTATKTNLLLQSSEHSALNYIAREDNSSIGSHLRHYVAVFDPELGKLQVTEAKHMTVRGVLRVAGSVRDEEGEAQNTPVTNYNPRSALTEAFGTKKSRKAVQSAQENRTLARPGEGADNPITNAMFSSFPEDDNVVNEVSQADALSNKPLPSADLETNEIDQVYSLDTLILPNPATGTLDSMPIDNWIKRISKKKEVKTRYRFVAFRVGFLVQKYLATEGGPDPKIRKALQVLRFIELMLDIYSYTKRLRRNKSIPPFDQWPENTMSDGVPLSCIRPITDRFFPGRARKDQAVTLLQTTILALTLHIPPPSGDAGSGRLITEPTDISLDMAIEASEAKKLYHELGCIVAPPTENDLKAWNLERLSKKRKDESGKSLPKPVFATLKFPLSFPKISRGRQAGRR